VPIDFTPDPALYPFESRWFESSAGRMHYVDEGSGPAILFCHGSPTWSFLYRAVIERLRDRFRCVASDMHGFGLSERPEAGYTYTVAEHARTLGELIDHLGLDGFVLMAQDWGGPVGTRAAADRAERVRGVALANTWYWPSTRLIKAFSYAFSNPAGQALILRRNFFVEFFIPHSCARELSAAEMRHYRAVQPDPAARVGIARFPKQLRDRSTDLAGLERDVRDRLGPKPGLILWGMKDWGFRGGSYIPRMQADFPDSEVVRLPAAAHYLMEDAPEEVAEAIAARFG
jgi:haloalkane dehalogenase